MVSLKSHYLKGFEIKKSLCFLLFFKHFDIHVLTISEKVSKLECLLMLFNMENAQQLYDQAFQYWEVEDNEKAKEYIQKALELAPTDLSVHALAMHIYRSAYDDPNFLQHAEFIVDNDIHYKDTLGRNGESHEFLCSLPFYYSFALHDLEKLQKGDSSRGARIGMGMDEFRERSYTYIRKILEAGYPIEEFGFLLELLNDTKRFEETIEISYYLNEKKSADAIGLPGFAKMEKKDWMEDDYLTPIMDAFFYSGRNEEALEWCKEYSNLYPDDYQIHLFIGEILCRMNRPTETAKEWTIMLQKGENADGFTGRIEELCGMVEDKAYAEKYILYNRVMSLKDTIPDDRQAVFEKIRKDMLLSIGNNGKQILSETYVEGVLQLKLPPVEEKSYNEFGRMWLPKAFGPHPYLPPDPKVIERQNQDIGISGEVIPKTPTVRPITIERYGIDLTEQVRTRKYPPVVGRDKEIDALMRILIRMEKNNPVLLGEAGVGKTAIIIGLAQKINAENVPSYLKDKRIIELPMSALVGGTMWRGDFETRITDIIKELRENKDIILFVDELHTIMGAGAAQRGDLDVANIAKPALAKGEIRLVGATTNHEYALYIEKDQAMARRFTPVRVAEMDRNATLQVLHHRVDFWREHHQVNVPEKTLIYAIDLTEYHVKNRRFPDKVIDLLDESCAYIRIREKEVPDGTYLSLTTEHVNHVFREWTGTVTSEPDEIKSDAPIIDNQERLQVTTSLKKHVVAQHKTVDELATLIMHVRHAIKDPFLPFVLLFHGPPGTGKTTAAHAIADTLWSNEEDRVIVLNMAEYADPFSYHRLIGGPPGYAGYDEEGILAARIKRKPFSVVILKNMHEAHPQVIRFFSSLFRTGVFTDKRGMDVLAGDILFVLHIDSKPGAGAVGFTPQHSTDHANDAQVLDMVKKSGFPAALLNAYCQVFWFQPLVKDDTKEILEKHIENLQTMYMQKGITLVFKDDVKEKLANYFYEMPGDKRNMEVLIDQYIVPKLREKMLKSKSKTITHITIDDK